MMHHDMKTSCVLLVPCEHHLRVNPPPKEPMMQNFCLCSIENTVEQKVKLIVIWNTIVITWRFYHALKHYWNNQKAMTTAIWSRGVSAVILNLSQYNTMFRRPFWRLCLSVNVRLVDSSIILTSVWCMVQGKSLNATAIGYIIDLLNLGYTCSQARNQHGHEHDDVINEDIFRVTGHLCGEFTGPRWIPRTKASDAELWCFLWSTSE